MKEPLVDTAANIARLEDFPMIDNPRICRRCNFRRLCFPPPVQARAADIGGSPSQP